MSSVLPPNVNVYFVRHAESCANISSFGPGKISHPPLSYKGMQQAINLGINNEIINKNFHKYYCSPSLRTIMTACLSLRRKSLGKEITLYLNSYLIEHKNVIGSNYDQQNSIVQPQKLKNMINYIKLWFVQNYFDNYIDYEFVHLMYDLVLLLHYNNIFQQFYFINELLQPIVPNRKQLLYNLLQNIDNAHRNYNILKITTVRKIIIKNKQTDNINDIYNNILQFIIEPNKFMIYQELYTENVLDYKQIKEGDADEFEKNKTTYAPEKYNMWI
jgi:hypothetical protein